MFVDKPSDNELITPLKGSHIDKRSQPPSKIQGKTRAVSEAVIGCICIPLPPPSSQVNDSTHSQRSQSENCFSLQYN